MLYMNLHLAQNFHFLLTVDDTIVDEKKKQPLFFLPACKEDISDWFTIELDAHQSCVVDSRCGSQYIASLCNSING